MQGRVERLAALLLFIILSTILIARGIVPALSKIDTDFPNYFTAAKIVASGGAVERLYDDSWFQEQMGHYPFGRPPIGKFDPFPPPTALLLVPLTGLSPLNALRVLTGVSVVCLIGSIALLARILSWRLLHSGVFVLLSGYAVLNALRFGQPYILVSFSCILGYYALLKGRPLLAGACFGLFAPIKYYPTVVLLYFAFRKQWKVVLGGAFAVLVVVSTSIGVLGWKLHEQFFASVLGQHLTANLSMQDPFTASFQSFDTLFRRLFILDPIANPRPLIAFSGLQVIGLLSTKILIFVAAMATLIKLARTGGADVTAPSIGILGILVLLLAPATATYHFALLWLPVGLLINYLLLERQPACAYLVLGTYAMIGFFPYKYTAPFEGRGGLTLLAYPRLFLLLLMFMTCVYSVWSRRDGGRGAPECTVKTRNAGSTTDQALNGAMSAWPV
jgi:hypothetical protein